MGIQIPLRKKVTLIPNSMIQKDTQEVSDDFQWFPVYFVAMMPSFTATISKAIRRNDNSIAAILVSVYAGFFLSRLCLSKYLSLPKNENLVEQFWSKLDMWFLYTAVTFGFVYQFADFSDLKTTVVLYIVMSVFNSVLFLGFVIVDLVKILKILRDGEDETRLTENRTMDAGKLDYYPLSIWEKV